jgi:3',5'-cyclic-AMP phosphodiesterase
MTNAKGNNLMDRRRFLDLSGRMLAVAGLSGAWSAATGAELPLALQPQPSLKVALLSDTHIPTDSDWRQAKNQQSPVEHLKEVVRQVAGSGCENCIVTGDLARLNGDLGDYQNWQTLMSPIFAKMPVHVAMGNHDLLKNYYQVFSKPTEKIAAVKDKHVLVIEKAGLRFVVLDSHVEGNSALGLLGKVQRQWLERYLNGEDPRPVFVFLHHALSDADTDLLDTDRLLNILLPKRQVKAIFYGHSHCYSHAQIEDLAVVNLPATGYSFATDQPIGWMEGCFTAKGAELILHAVDGNKALDGQHLTLTWR